MNICLLTPTFLPKLGGVEIATSALAKQFHAMGHRPCVVTQWPRRGKGTPQDNHLPYPVIRYRRPWSFALSVGMKSIYKALDQAHRTHKFDLINCHLVYPVGFVAVEFAKKHDLPLVITPHGSDIRPDSRYRRRKIIWKRIVFSLQNAQLLTAISTPMQEVLAEILNGEDRIAQIPNGVDIEELTRPAQYNPSFPIRPETLYILYLGGLTRKKGIDILLEAMNIIKTRTSPAVNLVVAGSGPLRADLEKFVTDNDLSRVVRFVGPATGEFKRFLFQNCSFVVMPSRTEGMPLVALEAFACGKTVVAADVRGLKQLVHDGLTGLLVPPEDPQALADAITNLADADWTEMQAKAKALAQKYNWPNIAEQYLNAYQRLVNH